MFFERKDMPVTIKEKLKGGDGDTVLLNIVPPDALPPKARLFSVTTLAPGCSIGVHEHTDESEIYYAMSGEGIIHDNGCELPFKQGDCHVCHSGNTHGIANESDAPLVFVAAIILE